MDFKITTDGDLMLDLNSNICECFDMESIVQKAMCIISSVSHDWFYDNIGADLEQLIGRPSNSQTISDGVSLIRTNLYKTGLFNEDDFSIESKFIDDEFIGFNVYISDKNKKYNYYLINVSIDMIKGIQVNFRRDDNAYYK